MVQHPSRSVGRRSATRSSSGQPNRALRRVVRPSKQASAPNPPEPAEPTGWRETLSSLGGFSGGIAGLTATLVAIAALISTNNANRAQQEAQLAQRQLDQRGQVTERFTRAIELLGSDEMNVRLGAIYSLERLAQDSRSDIPAVVEILGAFTRNRAPYYGKRPRISSSSVPRPQQGVPGADGFPRPPEDVQAAVTVLSRRRYGQSAPPADLQTTYLLGANLTDAKLSGSKFQGSLLDGAFLTNADLKGADLRLAILSWAWAPDVDLRETRTSGTDFRDAVLWGAKFGPVVDADFRNASLSGADFKGVDAGSSNFEEASLDDADLRGADLSDAIGLTLGQIGKAKTDDATRLPEDIS